MEWYDEMILILRNNDIRRQCKCCWEYPYWIIQGEFQDFCLISARFVCLCMCVALPRRRWSSVILWWWSAEWTSFSVVGVSRARPLLQVGQAALYWWTKPVRRGKPVVRVVPSQSLGWGISAIYSLRVRVSTMKSMGRPSSPSRPASTDNRKPE